MRTSITRTLQLRPGDTYTKLSYGVRPSGFKGLSPALCPMFVRKLLKVKKNPERIRVTASIKPIADSTPIYIHGWMKWGFTPDAQEQRKGLLGIYLQATYALNKLGFGAWEHAPTPVYVRIKQI